MKYHGAVPIEAEQNKVGVLLTNLGTPDAPTSKALRRYLREFLSDPRVVEVPRLLWWAILNGVILAIRPRRSAKAYRTVWTSEGSPLLFHSVAQCAGLKALLAAQLDSPVEVELAMRYGNPSIQKGIDALLDKGVTRLLVLPLYPQYCASTSGSTFDAVAAVLQRYRRVPALRFIDEYHLDQGYIDALADSVQQHWQQHGRADRLLMSFHGIPQRYVDKGDPYYHHCQATARQLALRLELADDGYLVCFQSRFGREQWLTPYTDKTLQSLPKEGVKSVQVICPGFSADCLETIEEIGEENRDYFLEAGGERYEYIAALNASEPHLRALSQLVIKQLQGWD